MNLLVKENSPFIQTIIFSAVFILEKSYLGPNLLKTSWPDRGSSRYTPLTCMYIRYTDIWLDIGLERKVFFFFFLAVTGFEPTPPKSREKTQRSNNSAMKAKRLYWKRCGTILSMPFLIGVVERNRLETCKMAILTWFHMEFNPKVLGWTYLLMM